MYVLILVLQLYSNSNKKVAKTASSNSTLITMPRSGKRKIVDVEDDEDFSEDEDLAAPMFSQLAPEASQSVKPESASDRKNLDKLDHETQEKFLTSIARLILFSGLEKEPIDRLKVIKDAGISSKDRIGSAAFQEASRRLQNVFGLQLNKIPKVRLEK